MTTKIDEIQSAIKEKDQWRLRELAFSDGGLVNDDIRKEAWPLLVGLYPDNNDKNNPSGFNKEEPVVILRLSPKRWRRDDQELLFVGHKRARYSGPTNVVSDDSSLSDNDADTDASSASSCCIEASLSPTTFRNNTFCEHLKVSTSSISSSTKEQEEERYLLCVDADLIERDVVRCSRHLVKQSTITSSLSANNNLLLERKQTQLGQILNQTLLQIHSNSEDARYYQGYHDVASIYLSVLNDDDDQENISSTSIRVLSLISTTHYPIYSFSSSVKTTIRLVWMPLLQYFDQELHDFLFLTTGLEPYFVLSWIITWFSHDLYDTALVKRLFDVFLVSHPLLIYYVTLAMVCHSHNRELVLQQPRDDVDELFATIHAIVSHLPQHSDTAAQHQQQQSVPLVEDNDDGVPYKKKLDDDETQSMASTSLSISSSSNSLCDAIDPIVKVPFQDLIHQALEFMEEMPPHCLLELAQEYYGNNHNDNDELESMMKEVPSISMMRPYYNPSKKNDTDFLSSSSFAAIACGYGTGKQQQRRRQRALYQVRRHLIVAVVVVLIAVMIPFLFNKQEESGNKRNNHHAVGE